MNLPIEKFEILQNAKEAAYLESKLRPFFHDIERSMLEKVKGQYRARSMTTTDFEVAIATLVAMDDLRNTLLQKIRLSKPIEEGIQNDYHERASRPTDDD